MSHLTMSDSTTGGLSLPTRMHRAARRLTRRFGAHGFGLLTITFFWTAIGVRALLAPSPTPTGILAFIPDSVELVLWWAPALLCLGAAIDREGPRRDAFALVAAIIAPILSAVSYATASVVGAMPLGWYVAVLYCTPISLVVLVAATPDEKAPAR